MKINMITHSTDNGDGSFSVSFHNTLEELLEDGQFDADAPTECLSEFAEWCDEDRNNRGFISNVTIEIREDGTIKPFYVSTD